MQNTVNKASFANIYGQFGELVREISEELLSED